MVKRINIKFIAVILLFCFGLLTGGMGTSIFVSYRMDNYIHTIRELELELSDKVTQIEKLKNSANKNEYTVNEITVDVHGDIDNIDMVEIKKAIKEKYNVIIGNKVEGLNPEAIAGIADNRIMIINNVQYKIHVKYLIISKSTGITVLAEPI